MEVILGNVLSALKVAFGIGMVIFIHELGHFMVARWCGVLVERFSIGFGPVLWSFKRGDTEYAISWVPLGGYVKMLGQSDSPGSDEIVDDERSYQNKSVGKRMAIISAGVIMNVILGFAGFAAAYMLGVEAQPGIVGNTIPGKPAWNKGLRAGDEIVEVNGHSPVDYETIFSETALTTPTKGFVKFDVERGSDKLQFEISPIQDASKPVIGILATPGLELHPYQPYLPDSPAARASDPKFEGFDLITEFDGQPVTKYHDFVQRMYQNQTRDVTLTVQRQDFKARTTKDSVKVKVAPNFVRDLGIQMQIGGVVAVQERSPASKAVDKDGNPFVIQEKDRIKAVDGVQDIDPMRLPDVITSNAGKKVRLTIRRPGPDEKDFEVFVVPENIAPWTDFPDHGLIPEGCPMSIPSIGIAYSVVNTIQRVQKGSAADQKFQANDIIQKIVLKWTADKEKSRDLTVDFSAGPKKNPDQLWPVVFWDLQTLDIKSVDITAKRGVEDVHFELTPNFDKSWPIWHRGFNMVPAHHEVRETTIGGAMTRGFQRTRIMILRLYLNLRSLVLNYVSVTNMMGPVSLFAVAYDRASEPSGALIEFLALLSINLAVINFLPIPVLDGGHMVFLIYEGIVGRKPSEKPLLIATWIGFAIIICLMLFVFGLDIWRHWPSPKQ